MAGEHFVGRQDAVSSLRAALTATEPGRDSGIVGRIFSAAFGSQNHSRRLTVQSIEGPGGMGKTYLLDHVLATTDLSHRKYLTLRIDGKECPEKDGSDESLLPVLSRLIDSAQADAIRGRPSRSYFPKLDNVIKETEAIQKEAKAEFQTQCPNNEEGMKALGQFLDLALEAGKQLNEVIPITREAVNFSKLKSRPLIEKTIPLLTSLQKEAPGFWEFLGVGAERRAVRNKIKQNACHALADALASDLSEILSRYRDSDSWRLTQSKVKGINRLLLILDDYDYEKLRKPLKNFLIPHFLDLLRNANFESVVFILVRDQLATTDTAWDQHFTQNRPQAIELAPLSRPEMDALVEAYGVRSHQEKERAWRDTRGIPLYVQLWIEETRHGGRGAVALMRFYDRTTRWMSDKEKEWLQRVLFLDHVNIRTLRRMVGNDEAEAAFQWFEREGSVRDTDAETFRVREYLRPRLIDYLRLRDPDRCDELERDGREAVKR